MSVTKSIARQIGRRIRCRSQPGISVAPVRLGLLVLAMLAGSLATGLLIMVAQAGSTDLPLLQPAPNSHSAPVTSSIVVSFAAAIDPATVSTRTIAIHSAQRGLVTGTYAVSETQVVMTPSRPFFPGERVQGVVTTDTEALSGPALDMPVVWQFRTATGAGSGVFFSRPSGLDSSWSEDIAVGDLDRDGDLDIFLGHRDAASTTWFNDGSGHFTTNGIDLGSDFLIDVSLADLDRDGDLDAILAGIQNNSFWWNNGRGEFSYGGEIFAGSPIIHEVVLGDLDGDADLDAVTVTACDPFDPDQACDYARHRIWSNNGNGVLEPSGEFIGHGTGADVALGDLDRDGDLDAMIVSGLAPISAVWTNLGGGHFTTTQTFGNLAAVSVEFGDLDGDGDLDAFVGAQAASTSAVWLNDGSGMLVAGQHLGNLGPVSLGDLDGDGDLDALSVADDADKVWLNQGDATFLLSGRNLGMGTGTNSVLGDVDDDGDLDAVTSGYHREPGLWINQLVSRMWFPMVGR